MTKYYITQEKDIEIRTPRYISWSTEDIWRELINRSAEYFKPVEEFKTLDEARAAFERYKKDCTITNGCGSGSLWFFVVDAVRLEEWEVDEEGELEGSEIWDFYAPPYTPKY